MKSIAGASLLSLLLACAAAFALSPSAAQRDVESALSEPEPVGPIPGPRRAHAAAENPYAGDGSALQSGRKLFVAFNCAGCHGGHAGGGMGPSLRDEDWIYGSEAADIFDSIAEGRAHGMPAWGTLLPPQYIWQLVSYIQALRTPQEPEPPQ